MIAVPLAVGVGIFVLLLAGRSGPEQTPVVERRPAVRVIEVPATTVVPYARGYGVVNPSKVWEAVAEVKEHPDATGGMAPIYGMASTLPVRGVIAEVLKGYMDKLYEP